MKRRNKIRCLSYFILVLVAMFCLLRTNNFPPEEALLVIESDTIEIDRDSLHKLKIKAYIQNNSQHRLLSIVKISDGSLYNRRTPAIEWLLSDIDNNTRNIFAWFPGCSHVNPCYKREVINIKPDEFIVLNNAWPRSSSFTHFHLGVNRVKLVYTNIPKRISRRDFWHSIRCAWFFRNTSKVKLTSNELKIIVT